MRPGPQEGGVACRSDSRCRAPCCSPHAQSNWLRANGIGKGDYVALYMPMVCELPIAMVCRRQSRLQGVAED